MNGNTMHTNTNTVPVPAPREVVLDTCTLLGMVSLRHKDVLRPSLVDGKLFAELRAGACPRSASPGRNFGRVRVAPVAARTVVETIYGDPFWGALGLFSNQRARVRVLGVELLEEEFVDVLAAPHKGFRAGPRRVDREYAKAYRKEVFSYLYEKTDGGLLAELTGTKFRAGVLKRMAEDKRTLPERLHLGLVDLAALEACQMTGALLVTADEKLGELAHRRNLDVAHPRDFRPSV